MAFNAPGCRFPGESPRSAARGRAACAASNADNPTAAHPSTRAPAHPRTRSPAHLSIRAMISRFFDFGGNGMVKFLRSHWRAFTLVGAALLVFSSAQLSLQAQNAPKRPLSYDVVDYWRSIAGTKLSNDGQWLVYSLTAPGDDGELVARNVKSGQEFRSPRGTNAQITADGKFVIFTIVPPKTDATAGEAEEGGGAPAAGRGGRAGGAGGGNDRNGLGIMTLADGKVTTIERVQSFKVPEENSTWLAYKKAAPAPANAGRGNGRRGGGAAPAPAAAEPAAPGATTPATPAEPEKTKAPGTEVVLRNLPTGQETPIPDVNDYVWNKDGSWLAYAVSSNTAANDGAFARKMADGSTVNLQKGKGNYKSLAFDDAGKQLAFLSDQAEYDKKVSPYRLYYWKAGDAAATELVSGATKGILAGQVVSDDFAPDFSKDGLRLFLGTAPPPPPPADPKAKAPTRVDLWSYKDLQLQPMQQVRAAQERNRNYRAVVHLADKRFVQLATLDLPNIAASDDANRVIGTNDIPYQQEISWDSTYSDVSLVDLKTGSRRKLLEHFGGSATLSPGGGYVLYFDEPQGDWFTYRIADGTKTNLTERLPVKFYDEGHDTPDLPGSLGSGGWTDGDKTVLLYDEFDVWEIRPDGTNARMITAGEGRKQHLQFRYRPIDTEPKPVPTNAPLLLATLNDDTKATGYYKVPYAGGAPEKIIMMDKRIGAPIKAKSADVMVITEQRFDEFPDLWITDTNFSSPKKVSDANPQQSQFIWGKAENIKYINTDGKVLNAMLIKPENFDPNKKYPLMVYIYEQLTQNLHGYVAPNVGTSINVQRYVSNGYIVLQPDIVYDTGYPGPSAMKCVIPAINTVVAQGYIDPKRIGIQGHSWGGYQITYMITQTNIFRAVEAGASVVNMTSAYGGIRWGTGMVREFQYEKTQSRIGKTLWESPLQFIENSPLFWIERINTPYLTIHNDADDAVPWYQGIEFNTAMRRLGKEAYMFSFNGEPHGLRNRDNMKYWTVHMDEFFDHYLLGKPRPEWMDKGVPFLQKGTRDVSPMFKRAEAPKPSSGR
ncbi:MAG: S9 family peptidase [Acidobacteria bacterium]|nr:MAG: S9 family peptidase [Acidobacteriota bacterium]